MASCQMCPAGTFKVAQGDSRQLCLPCPSLASVSSADRTTCECFRIATGETFEQLAFDRANGPRCLSLAEGEVPDPDGHLLANTQLTRSKEIPCPVGYWCVGGIKRPCPPGRFGGRELETGPSCAGKCMAGYWCGEASTRKNQNSCGGTNKYCPENSASPKYVKRGYYSNEDAPTGIRDKEILCPPGKVTTACTKYSYIILIYF
mmetsp:Transcript_21458/g.33249  ORF Transcript_21458/g.33249 Transcript_21458/m.33249 type:complete len:204 (+) Transcript_21458:517-1128(+)